MTGGGIPATHAYVELKLVFKDGGAFDFHSTFERVREQVVHALDVARESGRDVRNVIDVVGDVGGEELPAYEGPGVGTSFMSSGSVGMAIGQQQRGRLDDDVQPPLGPPPPLGHARGAINGTRDMVEPPNEDPPAYEDVQRTGVADSLEEGLRRQAS